MKKYLVAALGVLSIGSMAMAREYKVTVGTEQANTIDVRFSTVRINSSMCALETHRLELNMDRADLLGGRHQAKHGRIEIEAAVNPVNPCLTAFGPNSGNVTFTRGYGLPQLPDGRYELSVNGEAEGTLVVDKNGARLVD